MVLGSLAMQAEDGRALALAGPLTEWTSADVAAYINARYRTPMAMPPLEVSAQIGVAARNHALYIERNNPPIVDYHSETSSLPGFTGRMPADRCRVVGTACDSEIASSDPRLRMASVDWMATPYHGIVPLEGMVIGCGAAAHFASVCDLEGNTTLDLSDIGSVNTPSAAVRAWPFDGATDVPVILAGEVPDPTANFQADRTKGFGPVMFLLHSGPASVSLLDPSGRVIPLVPAGGARGSTALTWSSSSDDAFFPAETLNYNSSYVLEITGADGQKHALHFTTEPINLTLITKGFGRKNVVGQNNVGGALIAFDFAAGTVNVEDDRLVASYSILPISHLGRCGSAVALGWKGGCVRSASGTFSWATGLDQMVTSPRNQASRPIRWQTLFPGRYRLTITIGTPAIGVPLTWKMKFTVTRS